MPRRSLLTSAERADLLAFPTTDDAFIRHYTFSEHDLSVIQQRRGNHNRLGFAVQLCYLRFPGYALPTYASPSAPLLEIVGQQLGIGADIWPQYAQRTETRREHLSELQAWLNLTPFAITGYKHFVDELAELAQRTDRGVVLAEALVGALRQQRIIVPAIDVIERVCGEALTSGTKKVYGILTSPLTDHHRCRLNDLLLPRDGSKYSVLVWLRQAPGPPKPRHILTHLERLKTIDGLQLPDGLGQTLHQNRLLKLAREGGQMSTQHLRDVKMTRRHATLVAMSIDIRATLIDETIDLHDRYMASVFSHAKRKHTETFHESGKEINDKVRLYSLIGRALLDAKQSGSDPFAAIEAVIPWQLFCDSISESEKLARPQEFDHLPLIGDGYSQLRRYTPTLLDALVMKAAPSASELLVDIGVLREMNGRQANKVPDDTPTSFIRKRWAKVIALRPIAQSLAARSPYFPTPT